MELDDALLQISRIRQTLAQSQICRGYRSASVLVSAALAAVGAVVQGRWIPRPVESLREYLALWISIAIIGGAVVLLEMISRSRRAGSPLQWQISLLVLEQFLPSIIAGGILIGVVVCFAAGAAWMLPGLWAMLVSLGTFAACRFLPRAMYLVAGYYMLAAVVCLARGQGEGALCPWAMGLTFGIGQSLTALVLYWNLERSHVAKEQKD